MSYFRPDYCYSCRLTMINTGDGFCTCPDCGAIGEVEPKEPEYGFLEKADDKYEANRED